MNYTSRLGAHSQPAAERGRNKSDRHGHARALSARCRIQADRRQGKMLRIGVEKGRPFEYPEGRKAHRASSGGARAA